MAPPSYARATTSSASKARPTWPSKTPAAGSPSTPKKLKRPSTLTPKHRQSILYNANLYPIRALDPSKPCGLATLPSELRTCIYQYVLEADVVGVLQPRFKYKARHPGQGMHCVCVWPRILHVSQAMRIEAAYLFYTTTPFLFHIRNLDFSRVEGWLHQLPRAHRALLTRNRHLQIRIMAGLSQNHTYPPKGWLLDRWLSDHWDGCAQFGNVYATASTQHQTRFVLFCRLMSWFQLNDMMPYRDMVWSYDVDLTVPRYHWDHCGDSKTMLKLLSEEVGVLAIKSATSMWTRSRARGQGREEATKLLDDLEDVFGRLEDKSKTEECSESWQQEMRKLREAATKW
ncbi:hypothetical protein ACEQ8H_003957 [Pleosporales sp. CAS-2024a]